MATLKELVMRYKKQPIPKFDENPRQPLKTYSRRNKANQQGSHLRLVTFLYHFYCLQGFS